MKRRASIQCLIIAVIADICPFTRILCAPVTVMYIPLFGVYVAFNNVQVISRRVVGRAEETSTYSSLGLCTVNCRPTASNYQLSHLRPSRGSNPGLRGGRRGCYHSATVAPLVMYIPHPKFCIDMKPHHCLILCNFLKLLKIYLQL